MSLFTILEFAAKLGEIEHDMEEIGPAIVAKACEMVCAEAKRVLGTHDYDWPELKPETIANKMRGDTPLLETGEMRTSIGWRSEGLEGHVGSDSDKAVWQELGTSKIPPRSFLVGAAQHMEDKIHKMAGRAVVAVLEGGGLHGPEMMELLHLLKHAYHDLKETIEDFLETDEEKSAGHRR